MEKKYVLQDGLLIESENPTIYIYVKPNDEEKKLIKEKFDISDHDIASSIDEEELPRLDDEEKFFYIWKYPRNFMKKSDFEISSIGFFIRDDNLILITDYDFDYFRTNKIKFRNNFDVILRFMDFTLKHYSAHLKVVKAISREIQGKIISSMENKYLIQMFTLSESLVYYQSSLNLNYDATHKLYAYVKKMETNEFNLNYLENIKIENEQALKQAEIYSEVFSGLMDARASIVNNNMNQLMKKLTIINIIFLPLNLIAGIGGMSEYTSFIGSHNKVIGYTIFILVMIIIGRLTYNFLDKLEHKRINDNKKQRVLWEKLSKIFSRKKWETLHNPI